MTAAPVPADESAQLSIIGRTLFTLGQENPAALREYLEPLNAWERATAAEAIAYRTREIELGVEAAAEWRATPATMANHLTGGTYRLYRYAQLLGQRFADAFAYVIQDGYPHKPEPIEGCIPKQIWTLGSQYGKGLALDTPIPTPDGWTTMGELQAGDSVLDGKGRPCHVTLATPPRMLDCWRVETHDGATLIADGDHLWQVWDVKRREWSVLDTRALAAANPHRYSLPPTPGFTLPDRDDLPIHPYAFGVWLGDGSSTAAILTCAEDEILEHLAAVGEPARRASYASDPYRCAWSGPRSGSKVGRFATRLRALGVLGVGAKRIPTSYLFAGDKQRFALLQGLMDTDGSISRNQSGYTLCEFCSTNRDLAEGVEFLARSFGIRARIAESRAKLYGRDCGPRWRVQFVTDQPVFRLSRKAARLYDVPGPRKAARKVGFKRIERTVTVPTRCIQVDSPEETYLAGRQLTVTHNTSVLMNGAIWALDHNPRLRLMYVSYDADKAVEEGGKARDLAERHSADLRFQLRPDRRARGMWATQEGGGLYCVGIHGGITGYPADGVLLDDLFKGWQAAHSPTERETVWSIYRSQVRMRLQSFWCPVLFATTRWHEDDVPARMRKAQQDDPDADQWDVLRLPTIAEAPQPDAIDPLLREADPLGRMPGELLEPQRFPAQEVAARRAVLGPYLFAGLEQQRPAPVEGTEIKRDWFRVDDDLPPAFDELISSWDMKLKDKESGDYVVGQTWGRTAGHYWLLSQLRGQWDQPTTECAIVLAQVREARIRLHVLEASGNAPEVRDALAAAREDYEVTDRVAGLLGMTEDERAAVNRWRRHGLTNVVLEPVKGDKVSRMRTHSGLIESGAVHLWSHWSGVAAYLEEVAAFPNGAHDDQVDSTSQALKRLFLGGPTRVRIPDRPVVKPPIIRRGPSSSRVVMPSRLR